ncbi:MAG TPA: beta-eliminating lyase-related protein [Ilumatobacteraceae bacterium]|nr:beta-eliminating lyase-related protein [Ilumatobacteraceae bacterium]
MPDQIELRSDNAAGAAPELLAALAAAGDGSALAYGGDDDTAALQDVAREVFEHPDAQVFPVVSGTAANSVALSALCPPWGSIVCHETAHIFVNEAGAASMFGGGAVIRGLPGDDFKLHPTGVQRHLDGVNWGDPHHSQPSVISLTCPSDMGTVYSPAEVSALTAVARGRTMRTHLDGARLANAVVANGCPPADLTHRADIDVFSLGAIKNGAVSTDAIVSFSPDVNDSIMYRLKRAGHVASKMRFQSAQLVAYLTDGLWLRLASRSNEAMAALATGLREREVDLLAPVDANMAFARVGDDVADRLEGDGLLFYRMGGGVIRLVTSFQTTLDDVGEVLARFDRALTR